MLLRSSSTPLINSWIGHVKDAPLDPELVHQIPNRRSVSLTRAFSESDLRDVSVVAKTRPSGVSFHGISTTSLEEEESEVAPTSLDRLLSSSGLDEEYEIGSNGKSSVVSALAGGDVGGGSGRICGGGGGSDGGGGGGSSGYWDSNQGHESADVYYQKMIEANPGNGLLLGNYARFLKEVRGDLEKAEEYCGKAVLASPSDGNLLSLYADLIWQGHRDASRAERYFGQAVQAAPDDCYVLASYAHFLWDAEEEEEEEEKKEEEEREDTTKRTAYPPRFFQGAPPSLPPVAAAS